LRWILRASWKHPNAGDFDYIDDLHQFTIGDYLLMAFLRSNHDAILLDVFRKWPEIANAWHEYAQQVMRGPSALSEGERERV